MHFYSVSVVYYSEIRGKFKPKGKNRVEKITVNDTRSWGLFFYAALGPTTDGMPTFCFGAHGVRFSGAAEVAIYPTAANTDNPPTSHLSAVCLLTKLNSSNAGSGLTVPSSQILQISIVYINLKVFE